MLFAAALQPGAATLLASQQPRVYKCCPAKCTWVQSSGAEAQIVTISIGLSNFFIPSRFFNLCSAQKNILPKNFSHSMPMWALYSFKNSKLGLKLNGASCTMLFFLIFHQHFAAASKVMDCLKHGKQLESFSSRMQSIERNSRWSMLWSQESVPKLSKTSSRVWGRPQLVLTREGRRSSNWTPCFTRAEDSGSWQEHKLEEHLFHCRPNKSRGTQHKCVPGRWDQVLEVTK